MFVFHNDFHIGLQADGDVFWPVHSVHAAAGCQDHPRRGAGAAFKGVASAARHLQWTPLTNSSRLDRSD